MLVVRPHPGQAVTWGTKRPELERLQDLLGHPDLLGPIPAGRGGEGDPDGVADPLGEKGGEAGRAGHDALHAETGFGEPQMERIVGGRESLR